MGSSDKTNSDKELAKQAIAIQAAHLNYQKIQHLFLDSENVKKSADKKIVSQFMMQPISDDDTHDGKDKKPVHNVESKAGGLQSWTITLTSIDGNNPTSVTNPPDVSSIPESYSVKIVQESPPAEKKSGSDATAEEEPCLFDVTQKTDQHGVTVRCVNSHNDPLEALRLQFMLLFRHLVESQSSNNVNHINFITLDTGLPEGVRYEEREGQDCFIISKKGEEGEEAAYSAISIIKQTLKQFKEHDGLGDRVGNKTKLPTITLPGSEITHHLTYQPPSQKKEEAKSDLTTLTSWLKVMGFTTAVATAVVTYFANDKPTTFKQGFKKLIEQIVDEVDPEKITKATEAFFEKVKVDGLEQDDIELLKLPSKNVSPDSYSAELMNPLVNSSSITSDRTMAEITPDPTMPDKVIEFLRKVKVQVKQQLTSFTNVTKDNEAEFTRLIQQGKTLELSKDDGLSDAIQKLEAFQQSLAENSRFLSTIQEPETQVEASAIAEAINNRVALGFSDCDVVTTARGYLNAWNEKIAEVTKQLVIVPATQADASALLASIQSAEEMQLGEEGEAVINTAGKNLEAWNKVKAEVTRQLGSKVLKTRAEASALQASIQSAEPMRLGEESVAARNNRKASSLMKKDLSHQLNTTKNALLYNPLTNRTSVLMTQDFLSVKRPIISLPRNKIFSLTPRPYSSSQDGKPTQVADKESLTIASSNHSKSNDLVQRSTSPKMSTSSDWPVYDSYGEHEVLSRFDIIKGISLSVGTSEAGMVLAISNSDNNRTLNITMSEITPETLPLIAGGVAEVIGNDSVSNALIHSGHYENPILMILNQLPLDDLSQKQLEVLYSFSQIASSVVQPNRLDSSSSSVSTAGSDQVPLLNRFDKGIVDALIRKSPNEGSLEDGNGNAFHNIVIKNLQENHQKKLVDILTKGIEFNVCKFYYNYLCTDNHLSMQLRKKNAKLIPTLNRALALVQGSGQANREVMAASLAAVKVSSAEKSSLFKLVKFVVRNTLTHSRIRDTAVGIVKNQFVLAKEYYKNHISQRIKQPEVSTVTMSREESLSNQVVPGSVVTQKTTTDPDHGMGKIFLAKPPTLGARKASGRNDLKAVYLPSGSLNSHWISPSTVRRPVAMPHYHSSFSNGLTHNGPSHSLFDAGQSALPSSSPTHGVITSSSGTLNPSTPIDARIALAAVFLTAVSKQWLPLCSPLIRSFSNVLSVDPNSWSWWQGQSDLSEDRKLEECSEGIASDLADYFDSSNPRKWDWLNTSISNKMEMFEQPEAHKKLLVSGLSIYCLQNQDVFLDTSNHPHQVEFPAFLKKYNNEGNGALIYKAIFNHEFISSAPIDEIQHRISFLREHDITVLDTDKKLKKQFSGWLKDAPANENVIAKAKALSECDPPLITQETITKCFVTRVVNYIRNMSGEDLIASASAEKTQYTDELAQYFINAIDVNVSDEALCRAISKDHILNAGNVTLVKQAFIQACEAKFGASNSDGFDKTKLFLDSISSIVKQVDLLSTHNKSQNWIVRLEVFEIELKKLIDNCESLEKTCVNQVVQTQIETLFTAIAESGDGDEAKLESIRNTLKVLEALSPESYKNALEKVFYQPLLELIQSYDETTQTPYTITFFSFSLFELPKNQHNKKFIELFQSMHKAGVSEDELKGWLESALKDHIKAKDLVTNALKECNEYPLAVEVVKGSGMTPHAI